MRTMCSSKSTAQSMLSALLLVCLLMTACGSGNDGGATPTNVVSPAVSTSLNGSASPSGVVGELLDVVRSTLDAINRQDVDTAYANLSTDARKEIDLERVRVLLKGLKDVGIDVAVSIDRVGNATINGDTAEIELGLIVKFGQARIPVNDEASLIKEGGQWRIADHFLQSALVAAGLATPTSQGPRQLGSDGCAIGDPMIGVYAPSRLQILDACTTVEGIVRNDIEQALDGDITFGLFVSGNDSRLVNEVNVQNYGGALHIEIVPMDQATVMTPKPGDHVRVVGPWVTDLVHGHNEIHPAFRIQLLP